MTPSQFSCHHCFLFTSTLLSGINSSPTLDVYPSTYGLRLSNFGKIWRKPPKKWLQFLDWCKNELKIWCPTYVYSRPYVYSFCSIFLALCFLHFVYSGHVIIFPKFLTLPSKRFKMVTLFMEGLNRSKLITYNDSFISMGLCHIKIPTFLTKSHPSVTYD